VNKRLDIDNKRLRSNE